MKFVLVWILEIVLKRYFTTKISGEEVTTLEYEFWILCFWDSWLNLDLLIEFEIIYIQLNYDFLWISDFYNFYDLNGWTWILDELRWSVLFYFYLRWSNLLNLAYLICDFLLLYWWLSLI
jgi:hypothetical protein